ncbi:MAG: deoxyguanosinetriphosphate triphosphohydrolase, partial [Fimbriimonas ginsengisoli]|nr:deoxyguanosinetriphosphate triphosphohydrolase [Fimbriimonas ginsengisoli]
TSTLEAAVVRISDRIAYLNHDLDDAVRGRVFERIPEQFLSLGETHGDSIGSMVEDVIESSQDRPAIALSAPMLATMNALKDHLYEHFYLLYPTLYPDTLKAQELVKELLRHFCKPGALPDGFEGVQGAVDYVAGMTDRFAVEVFTQLRVPGAFRPATAG